jgi:hypothetical protein
MQDETEDEIGDENGKRDGNESENKEQGVFVSQGLVSQLFVSQGFIRIHVAKVSSRHVCGCWVLMTSQPARPCLPRSARAAWFSERPSARCSGTMLREEPSDPGAFRWYGIARIWTRNEHCRWKDSLQSSNFDPHSCGDLTNDGEVIGGHRGDSVIAP